LDWILKSIGPALGSPHLLKTQIQSIMAPRKTTSEDAIATELQSTVERIYQSDDRDQLSVNYVRQVVEKKLKLEEGHLKDGDWKARSKQIIHDALVSCDHKHLQAKSLLADKLLPHRPISRASNPARPK